MVRGFAVVRGGGSCLSRFVFLLGVGDRLQAGLEPKPRRVMEEAL